MIFRVLGPFEVTIGSTDVALPRREWILLAYLLLHANRTVSSQRIADAIWGDRPPRHATGQVHSTVYQLRRRLAAAGAPTGTVVTRPGGYRARVEPPELDLSTFRELRDQARAAANQGNRDEAWARYQAALHLWRGPALDGIGSDLLRQAAAALDEEHLQALEQRIEIGLALDRASELIAEITELVRQHPYRESLRAQLMLALHRAGRHAEALAAYRHVQKIMHDELGVEPGSELQRLHQAVLNRDPAVDRPAPAATPQFAAGTPPKPRELPAAVAGFTGRTEALGTLDDLLATGAESEAGSVVICTITGTAGTGKTALAVHWAHRVADQFPDGQVYLSLRGYATGQPRRTAEALAVLLRSLGTPPDQIPADEAEAAARYRSQLAGRRVLVVLDDAASVEQVRPLLPGSPGCLVLITSRDRMAGLIARDGARELSLDVFTAGEAQSLLVRLLGAGRVDAEPAAAAALASACAHLPLALRIATASLASRPHRTIGAYVAELTAGDRLTTLHTEGDDQSAVRRALDHSYQRIPADTRRMFRLLGLVPGPDFTPPVAAALADTTVALAGQALDRLASAHLVSEVAPGRYSFHDLLRLYARQATGAEESDDDRAASLSRLLEAYLRNADAAARLLYPQMLRLPQPGCDARTLAPLGSRAAALAWLDAERPNLVAATTRASEEGLQPPAWLLADRLRGYFWHGRHTPEWMSVATAALAAAERDGGPAAKAAAHFSLAHLHQCVGRHGDAVANYAAAHDWAEPAGWAECRVAALSNQGMVYLDLGELEQSANRLWQALALNRNRDDLSGQAISRINLGLVSRQHGQLQSAANHLDQALALNQRLGFPHGEAAAAAGLGHTYRELGKLDASRELFARAQRLYRETGDRAGEAATLVGLATLHDAAGRYPAAEEVALRAVALAGEINDFRCEADALHVLGRVRLHRTHAAQAVRHLQQALRLARTTGISFSETAILSDLAEAQHRTGDHQTARELAQQAVDRAGKAGYRTIEGQALLVLAEIDLAQREVEAARFHAVRAVDSHRATGHRLGEDRALALLGRIRRAGGSAEPGR